MEIPKLDFIGFELMSEGRKLLHKPTSVHVQRASVLANLVFYHFWSHYVQINSKKNNFVCRVKT